MSTSPPSNKNNKDLFRYASMGTQMLALIGVAVFLGLKIDQWLKFSFPLLVWFLPLLTICGLMYRFYKETTKSKKDNEE